MNARCVHGYTPREAQRLLDHAGTHADLLHRVVRRIQICTRSVSLK